MHPVPTVPTMLAPYRVLDLTDGRAELASFVLAGLGADVIKVEPPGGSASRLDAPLAGDEPRGAGQPALPRLQPRQAQRRARPRRPGAAAGTSSPRRQCRLRGRERRARASWPRAASGFDALRQARPDLVYVAISPFGQDGPYAGHHATDLTLSAMGGAMALNGEPDRRPVRITVPQTWHHAAVEGALGALVAHQRRALDRRGAVRRRVGAGGGVLDRPERDDRPRHPGPEHRAQRHRAPAEHAHDAARVPVRRRRGVPHRHVGHARRRWCRGWSRPAPSPRPGRRPRTGPATRRAC